MSDSPTVRRASPADVPALARMLARAFFDDPVVSWIWRPETLREKAFERYQLVRLRQLLSDEEVWTTADLACAALWAPPKRWRKTPREELQQVSAFAHPRLLVRAPLVAFAWHRLELHHPPRPPHWYLAVLGTDPAAQGHGLGSAVLGPVLEQCDADGVGAYLESSKEEQINIQGPMPAYLESSKERNISFYERFGFRVIEELRLGRSGPRLWGMWRDPPGVPITQLGSRRASEGHGTVGRSSRELGRQP